VNVRGTEQRSEDQIGVAVQYNETLQSVDRLLGRLSAIQDVKQRSYAVADRLKALPNDEVVGAIKTIREKALEGHGDYLRLYNGLLMSGTLVRVMGAPRMSELVEAAQRLCEYDVVSLLVDLPTEGTGENDYQPYLDADLREAPVGMRKSLARKLDFRMIKRIAKDQDPRVVGILLNNPRLTESEVVRIAATRPTSPRVIEEIYGHPRWISRYTVKKVIVLNPHTPLSIALRLLTYLLVQDLEEVCASADLDPLVLERAGRIVAMKSVRTTEEPT
jgi:CBS domain-containing protein